MMGYAFVMGRCWCCGRVFNFHPHKVPSIRDPETNEREPVCRDCIDEANPKRVARGLKPIVPLQGAYEPCHESEL